MVKIETKKQGRNEVCACGSGLKFKRCCGKPRKPTEPTLRDVMKCFYLILEMVSKENVAFRKGQAIPFPKAMLDKVPDDFVEKMICIDEHDKLVMAVKTESPIILTSKKRLFVP